MSVCGKFDGHDEVCLGQFSSDERPQWAPSSSIYIFHNYVLRPDPLRAEELFARPGAVLSWSPDGTKVALVHGRPFGEGPRSLVVLDINTMQQQTYHTYDVDVPHAGSPGFYTTWSNDSRYLAFSSRESLTADVLSLRIADTTTGTVNLIDEAVPRYASVSYSPDSSALLIQDGSPSIWVAEPDGSNRRLVAQGQLIGSASGPWYPGEPAPH